jgi:hypothetical protein
MGHGPFLLNWAVLQCESASPNPPRKIDIKSTFVVDEQTRAEVVVHCWALLQADVVGWWWSNTPPYGVHVGGAAGGRAATISGDGDIPAGNLHARQVGAIPE